jgi:hypothetical protein
VTGEPNFIAIIGFFLFIGVSLGITYFAAQRTKSTAALWSSIPNSARCGSMAGPSS